MSKMKLLLDVVQDLQALAGSLETLAYAIADPDSAPQPDTAPETPTTAQDTAEAADAAEPKLTIVELRAFVAERSTPENRAKIKAILGAFGVNKLTELKEEQYAGVMREVAAL